MNRLTKLHGIIGPDEIPLRVEKISFPIALENFPKHPAVTMKVAKLCVLQSGVEFLGSSFCQELKFRPETTHARCFGITIQLFAFFILRWIMLAIWIHC